MKKKIGIYGGSFNPFHEGHMKVIDNILNENIVDEVWIVPCKRNPLKKDYKYLTDDERLESIWSYVKELSKVRVMCTELEIDSDKTFTSTTLKEFSEKYPEYDFYLIIGADEWQVFNLWKDYGWILDNFKIIVHPRQGYKYIDGGFKNAIYLDNVESLNISATEIRRTLKFQK